MAAVPLTTYKTPGVYVQDIRKLPPSIAQVDTAIPVFIGYTEKAIRGGEDITNVPTRIQSYRQYVSWFGEAKEEEIELGVDTNSTTGENTVTILSKIGVEYKMNYALQMFYDNGGGACYIISVGSYTNNIESKPLQDALELLKYEPEPTLILFPDAVDALGDNYVPLIKQALAHCNKPKITNCFVIADVKQNAPANGVTALNDATTFRQLGATLDEYRYGAAYYPYLKTTLVMQTDEDYAKVKIKWHKEDGSFKNTVVKDFLAAEKALNQAGGEVSRANDALKKYKNDEGDDANATDIVQAIIDDQSLTDDSDKLNAIKDQLKALLGEDEVKALLPATITDSASAKAEVDKKAEELSDVKDASDKAKEEATKAKEEIERKDEYKTLKGTSVAERKDLSMLTMAQIEADHNGLYNNLIAAINEKCRLTLPPSSAMAGIYATVDSTRGVFKSPANVGLSNVIAPAIKLSDDDNDQFNVDTNGGKSINAIRIPYPVSGTLVWGARTLAGNDREWRYISVRRFFSMVQESTKRALRQFVFEPNNKNTWVSVRSAIESFLETQWRAGALLGNTPEDAYFVRVGMPETFTEAEMLDGFMVVEIGMAVVRPAEFIVLKFSHKFELGQG